MKKLFISLLLISFSASAALKDIPCSINLKRAALTPILVKKDPRMYFDFWLESLDAKLAHPKATPQEIAKMLKPKFGRQDLEKMKAVIEAKVAEIETKFTAWDKYFLDQKPDSFLHPGDLTIADYHSHFKKRAEVFLNRINAVLNAESFTYFDLLSCANMYSKVADANERMGYFISKLKKLNPEQRKIELAKDLKEMVVDAETENFHQIPMLLSIPTFKNLGFSAINTTFGVPIFYHGLVENGLWVDGRYHGIGEFYFHDSTHIPVAFDSYKLKHKRRAKYNYIDLKMFDGTKEYQFAAMIDRALKDNKLYGDFAKLLSDETKFNKTERKMADGVFFYWSHETPRLELLQLQTNRDVKEFFQRLEKDVRKVDFEKRMVERFNDVHDLGQAFKEDERPITNEMVSKVIRKVFSK